MSTPSTTGMIIACAYCRTKTAPITATIVSAVLRTQTGTAPGSCVSDGVVVGDSSWLSAEALGSGAALALLSGASAAGDFSTALSFTTRAPPTAAPC